MDAENDGVDNVNHSSNMNGADSSTGDLRSAASPSGGGSVAQAPRRGSGAASPQTPPAATSSTAGGAIIPSPAGGTARKPPSAAATAAQLAKLREANAKYKNLLKLAKERIQEQEGVLDERRSLSSRNQGGVNGTSAIDPNETNIIRVCQRIKEQIDDDNDAMDEIGDVGNSEDSYEIWALIEYETATSDNNDAYDPSSFKRYKQWNKFTNESALSDYIRRDTGEPLTLPPYSLSAEQSQKLAEDAKKAVSSISEEFRRFRVRAEVAKKQADATVRALHSNSVQTTRMRIEGQDIESELAQAKTDHAQLAALRAEMAEQEARWKESYDLLMAENEKLKSSGAEALLAAQWRHRYEACMKEKEDAVTNLEMEREKIMDLQDQRRKLDAGKYENKYRDLKESFRLYRKKAKEIFLAQQQGETGFLPSLHDTGAEGAKISYLKNLMVNYLGSDVSVREHMEPAIATVLNFTEDDLEKVKKAKGQSDSWF
ncbi:predicted protein [Thalassiosira pseudonana CCMP1335]|uniref:GRIP domain-containing protein n=1 Tax=Thalassiosira pseudonana TaxID=35128 RepID=B5YLS1_THAPS|nr:predicted protein [Thalassiosira pseudonana CCMP1335]ACI64127.1 predicted protein [Thalassiosira pseudonana CCMP1335]